MSSVNLIESADADIIAACKRLGKTYAREIARETGLQHSWVVDRLSSLEQHGVIDRDTSKTGRRRMVRLTESGSRIGRHLLAIKTELDR